MARAFSDVILSLSWSGSEQRSSEWEVETIILRSRDVLSAFSMTSSLMHSYTSPPLWEGSAPNRAEPGRFFCTKTRHGNLELSSRPAVLASRQDSPCRNGLRVPEARQDSISGE